MISDRTIICLASSWDYDPTSKHHLMRLLSRENRVLWVNYHGTRKPGITRTDFASSLKVLRRVGKGLLRISDTMWQLTPLVVPGAATRITQRMNERLLLAQIHRALRRVEPDGRGIRQVWSFAPDVPFLVGRLGEETFIYYCVDDYPKFQCHDAARIRAAETELLHRADIVIATSRSLADEKRRIRPDVHLVRHGVDFERFSAAWRTSPPCPGDLSGLTRPRVGFFGLIHHWIDQALLREVAQLRPRYSFVLLGEARSNTASLEGVDNIHRLGRRPYQDLPAYCAHFDAGLLPFACNDMTRSINPIKMHEYLAAGLPVVSTPIPEALPFAPAIRVAGTAREFAAACDAAVATPPELRGQTIARLVERDTWESRIDLLGRIIGGPSVIRFESSESANLTDNRLRQVPGVRVAARTPAARSRLASTVGPE